MPLSANHLRSLSDPPPPEEVNAERILSLFRGQACDGTPATAVASSSLHRVQYISVHVYMYTEKKKKSSLSNEVLVSWEGHRSAAFLALWCAVAHTHRRFPFKPPPPTYEEEQNSSARQHPEATT